MAISVVRELLISNRRIGDGAKREQARSFAKSGEIRASPPFLGTHLVS